MQRRDRLERQGLPHQVAALALSLAALLASPSALASPPYAPSSAGPRSLGGHTFPPPALLEGPFTTTHVGIDTSIGLLQAGPAPAAPPSPLRFAAPPSTPIDIALLEERIALGVAPARGVEIGARASLRGSVGTNAASAYEIGARGGYELRPHVAFEVARSERIGTALALRAGIVARGFAGARPKALATALSSEASAILGDRARMDCMQGGDLACAMGDFDGMSAMHTGGRAFGWFGAVSAAQAVGRYAGVQISLGGEMLDARARGEDGALLRAAPRSAFAAVAASIDLAPLVPIGALVEAKLERLDPRRTYRPGEDGSTSASPPYTSERLAAGIVYTGRDALSLGLTATFARVRGGAEGAPPGRILGGRLSIRYFF